MLAHKESWSISSLNHNGKEYIVRCNAWLWNIIGNPKYQYKVGIAIPINQPDDNGFPDKVTNSELSKLEDVIIEEVQRSNESLFAGSITGGGIKEFFLYTSNPEGVKKKFNKIKKVFNTYELQLSIQKDPKWTAFSQLCPKNP